MLMLSYESNFGLLGMGTTIGKNFVKISQIVPGTSNKLNLLENSTTNTNQLFARFNLSFNFSGNNTVAFAIKPFVQVPLQNIDLSAMADILEVENPESTESFPMWGVTFTFYNGRQ